MSAKRRAYVRDERAGTDPWFVYVLWENGQSIFSSRWAWRDHADRVMNSMNRMWEREGSLLEHGDG